jgi:hypothetical protein
MPRRPSQDLTEVEDLTPPEDPAPADDPAAGPVRVDRGGRPLGHPIGRRLGISVPGAIGGALLVCTLAFGASLGAGDHGTAGDASVRTAESHDGTGDATQPPSNDDGHDGSTGSSGSDATPGDGPDGADGGSDVPGGTDGSDASDATETPAPDGSEPPAADGTEPPAPDKPESSEPKPTAHTEPTPKPEKTPEPTPAERPVLGLELSIKEGGVLADWSACEVDGATAYKLVRSTDSTVRWPAGDGDDVVGVVEIGGATKAFDEHAPAGKHLWYRVFCVRHTGDGYQVLAASEAKGIHTPEKPEPTPTPTPEPEHLSLEAGADGGHIVLHWETCAGESFSHYRVLRKTTGDATLLTEIGDAGTTSFVDETVEPGVEYHYLVQCKGHSGDGYVLLGTTEWVAATVE